MIEFWNQLTNTHDLRLIGLSFVMCVFGAYATSALGRQGASAKLLASKARWLLLAILALSFAMWSSSFLAMLATKVSVPSGFAVGPMILSFIAAFLLVALGASVTLFGKFPNAPAFGGAIAGLSVSVMHYIALLGFRVAGTVSWDFTEVGMSVLIGIALMTLATVAWVSSRARNPALPIILFAIAICGDQLVGMDAMNIRADPRQQLHEVLIGNGELAQIISVIAVLILALTITARLLSAQNRNRRAAERRQLQQLADIAVEGLILCNGNRIIWINRSFDRMMASEVTCVGRPLDAVLMMPPLVELPHDTEVDGCLIVGPAINSSVPVRVITRAIVMTGRAHTVVAVRDQRERLRAEAELERLATSDNLTGLSNRAHFNIVLNRMFANRRQLKNHFAILSLDLDRFKAVNDRSGHAIGDAVLKGVADRLLAIVRQGDLVARLGGDEFSIIAMTGDEPMAIGSLAKRAIEELSRPFIIDGRKYEISVSIGIAFAGIDAADSESLCRCTDLALYRAKSEGRSTFRMFEDGMRVRMQERQGLEQDLRLALVRDEFVLHYQPQIDASTRECVGAEALLRWLHPQRGEVSPSEFIPIAEEANLITAIGEWVLRTACVEAAAWPDHMGVAVNLSPLQFRDPGLSDAVADTLHVSGLPGRRLELEITESVLIDDVAQVRAVLKRLKALGIRLSLDDFGTGYSSLRQLHQFPFDRIKIDRSFVSRLPDDDASAAIVRAVIALGGGLGMQTTAEGVETSEQLRFVTDAGCDLIQGYLFSPAVRAADFSPSTAYGRADIERRCANNAVAGNG